MFVRNRGTSRFSLLLLDEGEYYFEDFSVTYYPFARTDEQSILKYAAERTTTSGHEC